MSLLFIEIYLLNFSQLKKMFLKTVKVSI